MIGTGHIHEDMSFFHACSIGVFAFNCIIPGLIGGLVVIYRLCMAVVTIIRCIKNGYGAMVVLSLEAYSRLTDGVESALDEADRAAMEADRRYTHEEVFSNLRRRVNG